MSKRLIVFLTLLSVVVIVASYVTLPYYSEAPGPAREVAPLIQFTGHQRYDSQGHFVLTSVLESVQRLTALGALGAWLDPNRAVVPENEMVEQLVEWAEFINEHGIERALSKADLSAAKAAAEADRAALLEEKGDDANASEQRVELMHKHVGS